MPTTMSVMLSGQTATAAQTAAMTTEMAVASVATAGMGAYSYTEQARSQRQQGKYDAELARREAEITAEASEHEEREERREAKRLREKQFVQFAGGGVVPSKGTPLKVIADTQAEIEADIGLQTYGYGLKREQLLSRAQMERKLGKSKSRASRYMAGTSLATGAYRTASLYT